MAISIDLEEILQAVEADESIGWCLRCGESSAAEPDASNILCESCGAFAVHGAVELLLTRHIHKYGAN